MRLGVDLGGTKIEAVVLDPSGAEHWRQRCATPRQDYAGTLEAIAALVAAGDAAAGRMLPLGIGTPGVCEPASGLMKHCNATWLNGRPLLRDLRARLERSVRIANDADCFAMAEAMEGAAADARSVFGVILGTGVGGGIVIDGRLLSGPSGLAGEWGHNRLEPRLEAPPPALVDAAARMAARKCYCGRLNCIETWLSGPGLARIYAALGGSPSLPAEALAARAPNDAAAAAALGVYVWLLARALGGVINVLDPDVIVLGGGLSRLGVLYEQVPDAWARWVFGGAPANRLLPAHHGAAGGVRGAAWLWPASG